MITPSRLSYAVLAFVLILAGFLHLGAPLLAMFFSYFALRQFFSLTKRKWVALFLFVLLVAAIAAGAVYFTRVAILALPDVADTSIPSATAWAQQTQIELPYTPLVIAITFVCGLVPIVGNLVSNTVIVFIAVTVSLKLGIVALLFLVVIHKLEYLLNSKIIGDRIRNPAWLTLIALIIGERLMGIPGLILAPVVLNYLRVEMLTVEVPSVPEKVESLVR